MQIIRHLKVGIARYISGKFHHAIEKPFLCPNCRTPKTIQALGYYSRNITIPTGKVAQITIRRFRCRTCLKTVSILPSFAQPYRLIDTHTIDEYFSRKTSALPVSWFPVLNQYWRRFESWLPNILKAFGIERSRAPPTTAAEWWGVLLTSYGALTVVTKELTQKFKMTVFGRYRCHSPSSI